MVRTRAFRSGGRWFDTTSAISKFGQFRSPNFACVFRVCVPSLLSIAMSEEVKYITQEMKTL